MEYIIPIFFCLFFSVRYDSVEGKHFFAESDVSKRKYIFIFVWLIVLSALQYCVGYDIPIYMDAYANNKNVSFGDIFGDARYRPGWQFLQVVCHNISHDFVTLKIIQALFFNICVYKFLSKYSRYWYLTLFFYILYVYGQLNFGSMRQSFAVGFFLLSIPYLEEQETKKNSIIALAKYFGLVYLASLFHASAFVLYCVPLLRYLITSPKKIIFSFIVVFALSIIVSQTPNFNLLIYSLISSDDIERNARFYLTTDNYEGKYGVSMFMAFIPVAIAFISLYLNRYKDSSKDQVLHMLLFAYILMATLNIFIPIFYRFNEYFVFAYIVLIPLSIYEGEWGKNVSIVRSSLAKVCLFFMFILYPVNHLIAVHPAFGFPGYQIYYPYYSVFNPQMDPDRQKIINYN